ncbi:YihY/virulence factor BrkB family protein [Marinoscillum pacificum]|uniref:YihY/virulence factor BrkB family protein n=1 Tax=Marinoscillum pacificum TaxID=392723 RepID=UPI0021582810|nr:YihY/virulence factor BrkB family protein [Marinoscillum pacificum]
MLSTYIHNTRKFIEEDLWKIKIKTLPKRKAFLFQQLRVIVITISEFNKDKCGEKASALTYFSLISFVPVIAMAFGIAQSFGLDNYLERELQNYFNGQDDVYVFVKGFSDKMLANTSGGVITGISTVFLFYAVGRLLNNIEMAFNSIWNTKKGRTLKRKVTDYMSVILLGPIILIMSSSATVYITTSIESLTESISLLGFFKPVILFFIKLIPYTLIWFLLFLFYLVFPNTTVKIKPALIAGILAGTVYQITQLLWVKGQVYLTTYSVVYGTFAALPLFLIWLQLSWTILLFGAELAFAVQSVGTWAYDNEKLAMNLKTKRKMTLLVLRKVVRHFKQYDDSISFEQICEELEVPRRFIREVLEDLVQSKLVRRLNNEAEEELLIPGMDINKMDIYTVYDRLQDIGMDSLPQAYQNEGFKEIEHIIDDIDDSFRSAQSNKKIIEL